VTAAVVNVSAGLTSFSGVVQASTIMAGTVITTSVVSSSYTPGVGNLI
jgi:Na+-translocating ferredoxin:NAD+ oxidoreductase RnfG subunit